MLPPLLAEKRWLGFLALIAIGLIQTFCFLGILTIAKDELTRADLTIEPMLIGAIIIAVLGLSLGRYLERYIAEVLAQKYVTNLRNRVYEHTLALPLAKKGLVNGGGAILRLTGDMSSIRNWLVYGIAPLLVLSIWVISAVISLFQLYWSLALIFTFPLMIAVLGNLYLGKKLYRTTKKVRSERGRLIRSTKERLGMFQLIRLFNQSGKERRAFEKRSKRLMKKQISKAHASALIRGFNEAILLLSVLFVVGSGIYLSHSGVIAEEYIPILIVASLYLISQLRRLSRLYELWTLKKVSEDKITQLLNRETVDVSAKKRLPKKAFSVSLRRGGVDKRFTGISFKIQQRDRVVLCGPQESGKSSLLHVMAGLLELSSGTLRFAGRPHTRMHPALWAQTVSLVCPDIPLLKGSYADNLFYGARQQSHEYTDAVLAVTGLDEYLSGKGETLSEIDERGANLSSSLRFRMQLARALLRRPKLLLIDNDVAFQNEEVRSMLVGVFEFFDGAIVITEPFPEYTAFITKTIDLVPVKTVQKSKVISIRGEGI